VGSYTGQTADYIICSFLGFMNEKERNQLEKAEQDAEATKDMRPGQRRSVYLRDFVVVVQNVITTLDLRW